MKTFFSLFLIILSINIVHATDCSSVSALNYASCNDIIQSSLNSSDKDLLIANLDYSNKFFPDHNFISQKNLKISVNSPSDGTLISNGIYIRNAWVNLLSVTPGVFYNNSLYVNENPTVYSAYDYSISIPSNYVSSRYPYNSGGDCKTTYQLSSNIPALNVYVNNLLQSNGKVVSVSVNSDSRIKSELNVKVSVSVYHYKWKKTCTSCIYTCKSSSSEIRTENFVISDYLDVKHEDSNLFGDIKVIDKYNSNSKILIDYTDSISLNFSESNYQNSKYVYDVFFTKSPYNFYNLRATDFNLKTSKNLFTDNNTLIVKDTSSCSLQIYDFFHSITKLCDLSYNDLNLSISSDKSIYNQDEIINVTIFPSNLPVIVSYGNISKDAISKTFFVADKSFNKIVVTYGNFKTEKNVYVNQTNIALLLNLSVFGGLNYFFFASAKKFWRGFL